ncbi:methionyl-tRNA formyltransferase [Salinispirillum sp. LH 10-3-1]|uniref:Methionyl-tRNA formyltransferase n=1 Tax=Salinispirillum sp. LH 10-3-1 TaxID=2952525 RepID=A0AB38YH89_9GAMM
MSSPLRIIFAGTPEFAARPLQALIDHGIVPVAVYTQPDRPAGRGRQPLPSPVKAAAVAAGIPVEQPEKLRGNDHALAQLRAYDADLMIVIAYGLILPQSVLDAPRLGCVNVHASLLPRWRGAAPIQRAIEAGDRESGVCLMQMDAGLDTGPVISRAVVTISDDMNAGDLHDALAASGIELLLDFLPQAAPLLQQATPQPESGVTYAHKLSKDEAALHWQETADTLARRVRAFNPWPVSSFQWRDQTYRVWSADAESGTHTVPPGTVRRHKDHFSVACTQGWLSIKTLQPPGKKAMAAGDWLRGQGQALQDGEVLN